MSSGEMARCSWYAMKGYDDASAPHAIFAKPWADLHFIKPDGMYWMSSEISEETSWYFKSFVYGNFGYGSSNGNNKYNAIQVRAAVAFKL